MTSRQREHPDAAEEFDAAVHWYQGEHPGLGLLLVDRAERALRDIADWPDAGAPYLTTRDGTVIRMRTIHGFPYRIIYTVDSDEILILADAHERRAAGYWIARHRG